MSTPATSTTRSYLDFEGLGRLRGQAATSEGGAKKAAVERETAQQFEAMFIQMMMKSMREATEKGELMGSEAESTFQDMMDREVSVSMAKRESFGIAKMLMQNLQPSTQEALQNRPLDQGLSQGLVPVGIRLKEAVKGYALPEKTLNPLELPARTRAGDEP
jgi:Rod binding domain-containing protein